MLTRNKLLFYLSEDIYTTEKKYWTPVFVYFDHLKRSNGLDIMKTKQHLIYENHKNILLKDLYRYWVREAILISVLSTVTKMIGLTFNCSFFIQSVLSMNINSPIRELSASINQSFSGYLLVSTCQILCLQTTYNDLYSL